MDKFTCFYMAKPCLRCGSKVGFLERENSARCGTCGAIQSLVGEVLPKQGTAEIVPDRANVVINTKIKELRHLLVLQCEKLRENGMESIDLNQICNAVVAAERLMGFVIDNTGTSVAGNRH